MKLLFDWQHFERTHMNSHPFTVQTLIDYNTTACTLVDTGCLSYGVISKEFAQKHHLTTLEISPTPIRGVTGQIEYITHIVRTRMDMGTHSEENAFFYVLPDNLGYDLILGLPWLNRHDGQLEAKRGRLYLRTTGSRIYRHDKGPQTDLQVLRISASVMGAYIKRARRTKQTKRPIQIFSATMGDIQKALTPKSYIDPRTKLPPQYKEFLQLFCPKEASQLPPYRGEGIDHKIELVQNEGKDPEVPWGPLYSMSQEELMVLRKTLADLLDKNFIRVSHSSAAAPVLFVRKPGGGLRFCVDYRALNALTKKDRYPLPLINETLNQIGRAKWFTKLDVSAAFHKIRITKGQEWMTAFRTRYGLYEWLVTPFGLANAPSTFQKFINWALREYLDEFCSAYIDDVLVYTNGSRAQHQEHVRKTLTKLSEAGLYLDISKCEFECKETKYLGFIVRAGEGIQMDPEKVKAIQEWTAPTTVKGVRGFLGFANFYRRFIQNFSKTVRPLNQLTQKGVPFVWTKECQENFDLLKEKFSTGPVLSPFSPERTTVVETDSSGYNIGGVLSQYDDEGWLHPCAYFSKKNSPAECNYQIYDKELLAVVRCLEAWDAELRSVEKFKVVTDHKNLEYFFVPRKLTERHVRWSLFLSRFNFEFSYRKGGENERADALSRRDQDAPSEQDERIQSRTMQLLTQPEGTESAVVVAPVAPVHTSPQTTREVRSYEDSEAWKLAWEEDQAYQEATECLKQGCQKFPSHLQLKVSVSECELDTQNFIRFRGRRWVPNKESLRTNIIQHAHDSTMTGHPGREGTYTVVSREYFWPNMSQDVRQFVRNCDICGRTKAWREQKKGLLKPLPVPNRVWQDVSMDFITDLPESNGCTNVLVIVDRLSKGVILEGLKDLNAEAVAWTIVRTLIAKHGFPRTIVSDRGSQFVNGMWERVCSLTGVQRLLSTAYHPETDGSTERTNSIVEAYIRAYTSYDQKDWYKLLPLAELAINSRTPTSTGVSPFFLSHGYHLSPFSPTEDQETLAEEPARSQIQKGEAIVRTMKEALDWAQASMAYAQQNMEKQANRRRDPAPSYCVGDKVWLHLKNIRTDRPNKKLDWKNAKFTIIELIGTHAVRLDTPPGVHPVFHVDLLRPASTDPLPSQVSDDVQPPAVMVDGEEEFTIERILDERCTKRGRGSRLEYKVKWLGYARPTWEGASALEETCALDKWQDHTKHARHPNGQLNRMLLN